jgi:hypothetical protein
MHTRIRHRKLNVSLQALRQLQHERTKKRSGERTGQRKNSRTLLGVTRSLAKRVRTSEERKRTGGRSG